MSSSTELPYWPPGLTFTLGRPARARLLAVLSVTVGHPASVLAVALLSAMRELCP